MLHLCKCYDPFTQKKKKEKHTLKHWFSHLPFEAMLIHNEAFSFFLIIFEL